ncbi:MAG: ABC transporter permease [Myxococcota bacterium]
MSRPLIAAAPLLLLLLLPGVALVLGAGPADLAAGVRHPAFAPALGLSLRTSLTSLAFVVAFGTPLGWWLGRTRHPARRALELLVDLPVVLPPAVVGLALLQAFGRRGLFGEALAGVGLELPFTTAAVVLAQALVASPFYVQAAASAFREVDEDLVLVARTLGASPRQAMLRVVLPLALPGLVGGAALAWARALGEFGATLLFAGNRVGVTQTMPLAIYETLTSDVRSAVALALALAGASLGLLLVLRLVPSRAAQGARP